MSGDTKEGEEINLMAALYGAEPEPAVLLRDLHVHQPELPRLSEDLGGEGLGLVVLVRGRDDDVGGELARGID